MKVDDDHNIVEYDGTIKMIQDLFNRLDEDGDSDGIYDEPLMEKTNKLLCKGSKVDILSTTLILMN